MQPFQDQVLTKPITGIIHVGGHYGEEYEYYRNVLKVNNQMWFEPIHSNFVEMRKRIPVGAKVVLIERALGENNQRSYAMINLSSNNSESASLLKPLLHSQYLPDIKFAGQERIVVSSLDYELVPYQKNYNALVLDVQGYELNVLKGAVNTLQYIDYIWTEVNYVRMYEGCALISDIDEFLANYGFVRVVDYNYGGWGDAFYSKINV
jgi:FkbM family methyltransferase